MQDYLFILLNLFSTLIQNSQSEQKGQLPIQLVKRAMQRDAG